MGKLSRRMPGENPRKNPRMNPWKLPGKLPGRLSCALALAISIMLCGCAEVPDEVRENMKKYNKRIEARDSVEADAEDEEDAADEAGAADDANEGDADAENAANAAGTAGTEAAEFDFEYLDISELQENAKKALQKKYDQFELADGIACDIPGEISLMTFQYQFREDFDDGYMDMFSVFFTPEELAGQKMEESGMETDEDFKSYVFSDEADRLYGCVANDGMVIVARSEAYDKSYAKGDSINKKIYHVDRGDDLGDSYQLNDGPCTVSDAVDYVNGWLKEKYKKIEPDFDYEVKTVIACERAGACHFEITAECLYKGVPLDSLYGLSEFDEEAMRLREVYTPKKLTIGMMNACQVDYFTNGNGVLEPVSEEGRQKFVSLESALEFCEATFTDFKDVVISDVGIAYTLSPVYDYIGREETLENGQVNIYAHPAYGPGIEVVSRPAWVLVIDVDPSEYLQADEEGNLPPNPYGDVSKFIYVDMASGELHYNMELALPKLW